MKTEARVLDVTSTLQGEKVGMSIDDNALAHIMSVLTDLYSDPELAVIREYSTNAYDAHIEAGVTQPIEVTLPTTLSPYLKIRDYGLGLDVDDIREIYSRYGASTKRHTNDLVGTLGLGCKSALTYTNQFTLQGIKDGTCTQVSVSRDEDGTGSMTIVAAFATDDPSGVEITIPVKAHNDFERKAHNFFRFWGEGSVLVNGMTPVHVTGIEIDSNTFVVEREKLDHSVIVMGNVAYPMDDSFGFSVVAYVPIGAVQFTPSREALQMTPKTKQVIEDIMTRVENGKRVAVERMINAATTKVEALQIALRAGGLFGYKGDLSFGSDLIPSEFDSDGQEPFTVVRRFKRRYDRSQETVKLLPISIVRDTIFLTGYANKTFTGYQRQKLEQWWSKAVANHPGMQLERWVLLDQLPNSEWIDPARVYDYTATVAAEKLVRDRQDGKPAGAYRAWVAGAYSVAIQADEIDLTQPIFYHDTGYSSSREMSLVRETYPGATIVELTSNRVAKFQRCFPQAARVHDAAREIAQAWADSLKAAELFWLTLEDSSARHSYAKLDRTRVDDPGVKMAISLSKQKQPKLKESDRKFQNLYTKREITWANPVEKYPLLSAFFEGFEGMRYQYNTEAELAKALDHVYTYVNAVYAAEKESE